MEGLLPPTLMKLFGAQTAKKLNIKHEIPSLKVGFYYVK